MPFAKIKAAFIGTGVSIHYELSTPTSSTAKAIDPKLPTLIFLHGVYIASVRSLQLETTRTLTECADLQPIFHSELFCVSCLTHCSPTTAQFSDHVLRRHNLIALDSRLHGSTLGGCGKDWSVSEAAEDVNGVMVCCPLASMQGGLDTIHRVIYRNI